METERARQIAADSIDEAPSLRDRPPYIFRYEY
jgi:hypothetical protein